MEMFDLPQLSFKRSVRSVNTVKNPVLVIFSDASKEVYGACCYIRCELSDGTYKSTILLSKIKIAPVKIITIVRLELSDYVFLLKKNIVINLNKLYT